MALEKDLFTAILFSVWKQSRPPFSSDKNRVEKAKEMKNECTHLIVQLDLLRPGRDGHEPEQPAELLPAAGVLQLQAELQGLQSLALLPVDWRQRKTIGYSQGWGGGISIVSNFIFSIDIN